MRNRIVCATRKACRRKAGKPGQTAQQVVLSTRKMKRFISRRTTLYACQKQSQQKFFLVSISDVADSAPTSCGMKITGDNNNAWTLLRDRSRKSGNEMASWKTPDNNSRYTAHGTLPHGM